MVVIWPSARLHCSGGSSGEWRGVGCVDVGVGCMGCGVYGVWGVWGVWGVGCMGCGVYGVWGVWGVGCMGCGVYGVWGVWGVGCRVYGVLGVWDIGCMGCGVWGVWGVWVWVWGVGRIKLCAVSGARRGIIRTCDMLAFSIGGLSLFHYFTIKWQWVHIF